MENLRSFFILDSQSDENFDRITRLASEMLGLPVALISLVDEDRQWFLSRSASMWPSAPTPSAAMR
jgi:hypothetical protein